MISKTALGNIRETTLQEKQIFYILTFQLQDLTREKKSPHAKACMLDYIEFKYSTNKPNDPTK